jgi:LuxR family quorum-sensing system transcriptional regulator SolR
LSVICPSGTRIGLNMNTWREEITGGLLGARNHAEAFEWVTRYGNELGFEHCAYGMRAPLPISRTPFSLLSNYPECWQRRYKERNYLLIDPTVRHGLGSTSPILWPTDPVDGREFWEEAWAAGLRHGWAQASRDASGAVGMLSFARAEERITASELDHIESKMALLAQTAHIVLSSFLMPSVLPESTRKLSLREREILRWTAEGKTSYEIGSILGVTARTINFHVNNAVAKLAASNKTHAVVKAALLGILF